MVEGGMIGGDGGTLGLGCMVILRPGRTQMLVGDIRLESVWEWLKKRAASSLQPGSPASQFTAQVVDEHHQEKIENLDALWHFAIAGIIRPGTTTQFTFTDEGRSILTQDVSPYQYHEFLEAVEHSAPLLDDDCKAYLSLALSCIYQVPAASVVLSRVALEIEVDSLIDACIAAWQPGTMSRRKLTARDLGVRARELVNQLRNRDLQTTDDNDLFESHINEIRITANQVLHPSGGPPITNPMAVQSVLYAFIVFAELTSAAKVKVQNSSASAA